MENINHNGDSSCLGVEGGHRSDIARDRSNSFHGYNDSKTRISPDEIEKIKEGWPCGTSRVEKSDREEFSDDRGELVVCAMQDCGKRFKPQPCPKHDGQMTKYCLDCKELPAPSVDDVGAAKPEAGGRGDRGDAAVAPSTKNLGGESLQADHVQAPVKQVQALQTSLGRLGKNRDELKRKLKVAREASQLAIKQGDWNHADKFEGEIEELGGALAVAEASLDGVRRVLNEKSTDAYIQDAHVGTTPGLHQSGLADGRSAQMKDDSPGPLTQMRDQEAATITEGPIVASRSELSEERCLALMAIVNEKDRLFIQRESVGESEAGYYGLPGALVRDGEKVEDAALRAAYDAVGLPKGEVEVFHLNSVQGMFDGSLGKIVFCFCRAPENWVPANDENQTAIGFYSQGMLAAVVADGEVVANQLEFMSSFSQVFLPQIRDILGKQVSPREFHTAKSQKFLGSGHREVAVIVLSQGQILVKQNSIDDSNGSKHEYPSVITFTTNECNSARCVAEFMSRFYRSYVPEDCVEISDFYGDRADVDGVVCVVELPTNTKLIIPEGEQKEFQFSTGPYGEQKWIAVESIQDAVRDVIPMDEFGFEVFKSVHDILAHLDYSMDEQRRRRLNEDSEEPVKRALNFRSESVSAERGPASGEILQLEFGSNLSPEAYIAATESHEREKNRKVRVVTDAVQPSSKDAKEESPEEGEVEKGQVELPTPSVDLAMMMKMFQPLIDSQVETNKTVQNAFRLIQSGQQQQHRHHPLPVPPAPSIPPPIGNSGSQDSANHQGNKKDASKSQDGDQGSKGGPSQNNNNNGGDNPGDRDENASGDASENLQQTSTQASTVTEPKTLNLSQAAQLQKFKFSVFAGTDTVEVVQHIRKCIDVIAEVGWAKHNMPRSGIPRPQDCQVTWEYKVETKITDAFIESVKSNSTLYAAAKDYGTWGTEGKFNEMILHLLKMHARSDQISASAGNTLKKLQFGKEEAKLTQFVQTVDRLLQLHDLTHPNDAAKRRDLFKAVLDLIKCSTISLKLYEFIKKFSKREQRTDEQRAEALVEVGWNKKYSGKDFDGVRDGQISFSDYLQEVTAQVRDAEKKDQKAPQGQGARVLVVDEEMQRRDQWKSSLKANQKIMMVSSKGANVERLRGALGGSRPDNQFFPFVSAKGSALTFVKVGANELQACIKKLRDENPAIKAWDADEKRTPNRWPQSQP